MNRTVFIEDETVLSDSGTYTVNLNLTEPVTRLTVLFQADNHASGPNINNRIAECISKIELVSGSNVLFSLSGLEAQGAYFYNTRMLPEFLIDERDSKTQLEAFPIMFGRLLNDPDLGLDPLKHPNLQFKITWDLATVTAVGAASFATGTAKLSLIADVMEGAPKPNAVFMLKSLYNFTTQASGQERIEVPTDYPYRKMLVRVHKDATAMETIISNIKLSLEQDSFIPYDMSIERLMSLVMNYYPAVSFNKLGEADDADTLDTHIGYLQRSEITPMESGAFLALSTDAANQVTVKTLDHANATVSNVEVLLRSHGYCFNNVVPICFGRWNVPSEYLNFSKYRTAHLVLTQAVVSGDVSVFTEQVMTY